MHEKNKQKRKETKTVQMVSLAGGGIHSEGEETRKTRRVTRWDSFSASDTF